MRRLKISDSWFPLTCLPFQKMYSIVMIVSELNMIRIYDCQCIILAPNRLHSTQSLDLSYIGPGFLIRFNVTLWFWAYDSTNPFLSQDCCNRFHIKNRYWCGYLFKIGPVQILLNKFGCHFLPTSFYPRNMFSECQYRHVRESYPIFHCLHPQFIVDIYWNMESPCHKTFTHLVFTCHTNNIYPAPIYQCSWVTQHL